MTHSMTCFVGHVFSRECIDDLRRAITESFANHPSVALWFADEHIISGHILHKVTTAIDSSSLCIFEISEASRPNVFIELGYALARGKACVFLLRKGQIVPSDLAGFDRIEYESMLDLTNKMKEFLPQVLASTVAANAQTTTGEVRIASRYREDAGTSEDAALRKNIFCSPAELQARLLHPWMEICEAVGLIEAARAKHDGQAFVRAIATFEKRMREERIRFMQDGLFVPDPFRKAMALFFARSATTCRGFHDGRHTPIVTMSQLSQAQASLGYEIRGNLGVSGNADETLWPDVYCQECGCAALRNGECYKCFNCGASVGCLPDLLLGRQLIPSMGRNEIT